MGARLLAGSAVLLAALAGSAVASAADPPYVTTPPFLVGPEQQGLARVLSVSAGGFGGKQLTLTYVWNRCDASGAGCVPIPAATAAMRMRSDDYVEQSADTDHTIRVDVTAANRDGTVSSWSNASPIVTAAGSVASSAAGQGRFLSYRLYSAALRRMRTVDVYLPAGYRARGPFRYPVLYVLHGYPGSPSSIVDSLAIGAAEETLVAEGLMRPLVLVIPDGEPDPIAETSWLDSPVTGDWERFVTRDVVGFVDECFSVDRGQAARGVAGLSDGGFGALNFAIHHPAEFRLAESWSGYERADPTESALAGASPAVLDYDSPADQLPFAAERLRRRHVDFWLYVGADDSLRFQNEAFARELAADGVDHQFALVAGSHLPSVYRANLPEALTEASNALTGRFAERAAPAPATSCPAGQPLAAGV